MAYEQYPGAYPPQQYAQPAPYGAGYGYGAPQAAYAPPPVFGEEQQRTIFITGFPLDVKERELNNLLRFLPGYEASQMNWKNGQAQGFAMFANTALARAGCDAISQLMFDETAVLRCEMARKNMYIKEDSVKRPRGMSAAAPGSTGGYGAPAPFGAPRATSFRPVTYDKVSNTSDNPPCNTLFIGNLGDATDEEELRNLLAAQPGFCQLKLIRGVKATSCFAEFADLPTAMAAHQSQQGAVLTTSDRGGIRIQYSKSPFGKKRDFDSGPGPRGSGQEYAHNRSNDGASQVPAAEGADPAAPGV